MDPYAGCVGSDQLLARAAEIRARRAASLRQGMTTARKGLRLIKGAMEENPSPKDILVLMRANDLAMRLIAQGDAVGVVVADDDDAMAGFDVMYGAHEEYIPR